VAEDVLEVVDGQDRGARFAILGSEAVIGRDPVVDLVLTDPSVSGRHAALRLEGERLLIRDLGSSSGTRVNGRTADGPTALRVGDRVRMGGTELAVVWAPGAPPAEPIIAAAPEPAIPVAPAPAPARAPRAPRRGDIAHIALAAAVIALSATALGAVWIDFADHSSLWGTDQNWLRAQGIGGPLAGLAVGVGWLAAAAVGPVRRVRGALAALAAGLGGFVAGLPTAVATTRGIGGREAGLWLTVAAGAGIAGCGLAGALLGGARAPGPRRLVIGAGALGVVGGALAAAGSPLDWLGTGISAVDGFELRSGKCLLAIALLVVIAFGALVAARWLGRDRTTAILIPVALVLAGLALGFAGAYVTAFVLGTPLTAETGLVLAVIGALVAALAGLGLVLARVPPRTWGRRSGPTITGLR